MRKKLALPMHADKIAKLVKPSAKKRHKSVLKESGGCVLAVEIENRRRFYFRINLSGNGCERISETDITPETTVITVFRNDWRLEVAKPTSNKAVINTLARERDELSQLTIINQSRSGGAIYTTQKSRVLEDPWEQAPLASVLDQMLGSAPQRPLVCGVVFGELEVVVLFLYREEGGLSAENEIQVSITPNSLDEVVNNFIMVHHLRDAEPVIFDQTQFTTALLSHSVTPYPKHLTVLGVPYQQLIAMAAVGIWMIAAATAVWAGWEYVMRIKTESEIESVVEKTAIATKQTGEALTSRIPALAQYTAIQYLDGLALAAQLRPHDGRVQATLTTAAYEYNVLVPLRIPKEKNALQVQSLERAAAALTLPPPPGCNHTSTSITGGFNELKTDYLCPHPVGGVAYDW